jgi:ER-bound oxygenase mpaB/B'/Rubber oxygenase, catalytic domain
VHACLVDSFLLFERLTVGRLDNAGGQAFHGESMVSAELLRLPRERIPPTVPALRAYLDEVMASGILRMTDGARRVADLFGDPPRDVPQRPLWLLRASLLGLRLGRPLAPPRIRFVAPAVMAGWRLEGRYGSLAEAAAHWPGG